MFDYLLKLLGIKKEEKLDENLTFTPRTYHFELPYVIKAYMLFYGIVQLKDGGVFQRLPKDIQHKMEHGRDAWHDIRVHKDDLDRIDDVTWTAIANKLGLHWSP